MTSLVILQNTVTTVVHFILMTSLKVAILATTDATTPVYNTKACCIPTIREYLVYFLLRDDCGEVFKQYSDTSPWNPG